MFSRKYWWIWILALAAAGMGGGYAWQYRQQALEQAARDSLRQEIIGRGTVLSIVSATGAVAPEQQVNLFFGVAAPLRVAEVNVVLGQAVRAGQVLARLETADLELAVTQAEQAWQATELALELLQAPARDVDLALAEANLRLAQAQVYAASVGRSSQEVQIAYLNLRLAQNTLDQTHRTMDALVQRGQFAQKEAMRGLEDQQIEAAQVANLRYLQTQEKPTYGPVASAQAAVAQAEAALQRLQSGPAEADLDIARQRTAQARAALALARNNLADAELRAPFDGVVAGVNARLGELAASGLPAVTLADVSQFHVDLLVDEVDVARLAAGQPVTISLDALPDLFLSGQVKKIAATSTVNQGVVSYLVRVRLSAGQAPLRGGMTATADVVVDEARDVLLAPNWAIRRERETGRTFVGVLRAGVIVEVEVELGLRNESVSEVRRGLSDGDVAAVQTAREEFSFFGGGE